MTIKRVNNFLPRKSEYDIEVNPGDETMRVLETKEYDLEINAGPCSVSSKNPGKSLAELHAMAEIQVPDGKGGMKRALSAGRFIGLKSRTEYNPTGEGMGMDFEVVEQAIISGSVEDVPPSVLLAEQFVREAKIGVAAEIMIPGIQLPFYEGRIPKGMLLPWNPSNNQLGWTIREMAAIAGRNNWTLGLKNGKWLGAPLEDVSKPDSEIITSMEKTWLGLASYAEAANDIVFIHRGVDVPGKGENRNALTHEVVRRLARLRPNVGRWLDPSHSLGDKLRDVIIERTIEAMWMKVGNGSDEFLYTGILIEAGSSETDTGQHISVNELEILAKELSKFRRLRGPLVPID